MKMRNFIKYIIILFAGIIIQGCKDSSTNVDNTEIPASNVSYSKHIAPVLEQHCVGCHNNQDLNGGLSLQSYATVTADLSIVFPGKPENSKLVWRIDPTYGLPLMPPMGSAYKALSSNQVTGIKTWIKEGAKDN